MALKNIMRVDNGNIVGGDAEARNFINNNLITSVNGTDVEFKFIYDSTQDKFGYRDASGTFVPFESGGDFSQLIYENLAAANIKSGTTISVKDPDGTTLKSVTGTYVTAPVLIGTYTGNKTISVASYKRSTDTVNNFLVEISKVNGSTSTYVDVAYDSGYSKVTVNSATISKSLSGNNLVISGATFSGSAYYYGGSTHSLTSCSITYKVYHV